MLAHQVSAANPSIQSFVSSNGVLLSGQLTSLVFSSSDTSGHSLVFTCSAGIKIKNQEGAVFLCGTAYPLSSANGEFSFTVINTSGSQKNISASLYPKALSGEQYSEGVKQVSFSVLPVIDPITSFYALATSTVSKKPTILYWTSPYLDAVNFKLTCAPGIYATSSVSANQIPCDQISFSQNQLGSGQVTLYFSNTNAVSVPVTITVLPAISDGAYDAIYGKTIVLDVAPDLTPSPVVSAFTAVPSTVSSQGTSTLLWTVDYSSGANITFECKDNLSAKLVTGTSIIPIQCGSFMFTYPVSSRASASVVLVNNSTDTLVGQFLILPELSSGGYDGTRVKSVSVSVLGKGIGISPAIKQIQSTTTVLVNNTKSPRKKFTKALGIGSRGDDVSALQEYLFKNNFYPEGNVSGYFGPTTSKAVGRFQEFFNIAKKGGVGYGVVGPVTRSKLNTL
jgi:hypothetical protein